MKRVLCVLLTACLCVGAAGCGNGKSYGALKKENEELQQENEGLKKENEELGGNRTIQTDSNEDPKADLKADSNETKSDKALPHNERLSLDSTKSAIENYEKLEQDSRGRYNSNATLKICERDFSINYNFGNNYSIERICYAYNMSNEVDANETQNVLRYNAREYLKNVYGEEWTTNKWKIHMMDTTSYEITIKLPDYSSETSMFEILVNHMDEQGDQISNNTPEEEEALEKEQKESLAVYADMISEIETDIPELKVSYIVSKDDGTGKILSIRMDLLESKDMTIHKIAELTALKETLMNSNGITDIQIFVYNQEVYGEGAGIVLFSNEGGTFQPTLNTI